MNYILLMPSSLKSLSCTSIELSILLKDWVILKDYSRFHLEWSGSITSEGSPQATEFPFPSGLGSPSNWGLHETHLCSFEHGSLDRAIALLGTFDSFFSRCHLISHPIRIPSLQPNDNRDSRWPGIDFCRLPPSLWCLACLLPKPLEPHHAKWIQ